MQYVGWGADTAYGVKDEVVVSPQRYESKIRAYCQRSPSPAWHAQSMSDQPPPAPPNWADLMEEAIRDAELSSRLLQEANRRIQALERELARAQLKTSGSQTGKGR